MQVNLTPEDIIEFENKVCKNFADKKIKAPIHLNSNNEEQMIEIFSNHINEDDWCLGSWRSHYMSLLKGVPQEELMQAILEGKSISLCFPEYKTISSAIVGGILPIALGIALGIKLKGEKNKAICFLGDTTSETGIFHECVKYSKNHKLNVLWVIEDNGKSVCTDTREVWGTNKLTYEPEDYKEGSVAKVADNILYYKYSSRFPHAGLGGQRINF